MTDDEGTHEMTQHRWKGSLPRLKLAPSLTSAARMLVWAMDMRDDQRSMRIAAAHIRAVRKQIEAERGEGSDRQRDLPALLRDEELLWYALQHSATAGRLLEHDDFTLALYFLRLAEAALRTLWRRGQA